MNKVGQDSTIVARVFCVHPHPAQQFAGQRGQRYWLTLILTSLNCENETIIRRYRIQQIIYLGTRMFKQIYITCKIM